MLLYKFNEGGALKNSPVGCFSERASLPRRLKQREFGVNVYDFGADAKGDAISYHYDIFGRLEFVKDKDGHMLSENEYHYKNQ